MALPVDSLIKHYRRAAHASSNHPSMTSGNSKRVTDRFFVELCTMGDHDSQLFSSVQLLRLFFAAAGGGSPDSSLHLPATLRS
jgi:hypothetical protein